MKAETKNTGKNKSICNERGIFMKHVITGLGIGIFILFLFMYFGFIGDASFTLLLIVNVFCCMFVFYEPRIKKGSATASGIEIELSERVEQIEKQTKAIAAKEAEPTVEIPSPEQNQAEVSGGFGFSSTINASDISTTEIIQTINGSNYTFRSIDGIARDLKAPRETVEEKLAKLTKKGFADSFNIGKRTYYALTIDGRDSLEKIIQQQ